MILSAVAFVLASETAMASALPVLLTGRYSWRVLPCIPAHALHLLSHTWHLVVRLRWPPVHHVMFAACHSDPIGGDDGAVSTYHLLRNISQCKSCARYGKPLWRRTFAFLQLQDFCKSACGRMVQQRRAYDEA